MARGVPRELVDFEAATDPNAVQNIYGARGAGAIASSVWPRSRPLRLISLIFLLLVASPAIVAVVMTIIAHLQGGGSAPAPPH
ncbi:MAG TPA: hypothetical protein VFB58_13470 [Chloroflexota bacterium]|nr:hypothetical protein [Chloroflexota bacterium]